MIIINLFLIDNFFSRHKIWMLLRVQYGQYDTLLDQTDCKYFVCQRWNMKNLFSAHFGHLWPRIFSKRWFQSILSLYANATLYQKSEKLWEWTFHKTWETSFWALFAHKHQSNMTFQSTFTWDPKWTQTGLRFLLRGEISLRCKATSLSAFTWLQPKWNSLWCKFHFASVQISVQISTAQNH